MISQFFIITNTIFIESGYFFWDPEISYHHGIHRFCSRIFGIVEIEKSGRISFDDGSFLRIIISCGIEYLILLHRRKWRK